MSIEDINKEKIIMGTKSITISFGGQSKTYQLSENFNVMQYRANGNMKNKLIFDFFDDAKSKTYQAANEQEFNHILGFLRVADKTGDGIINDEDCVALDNDKNKPKEILTAYGEDGGSFIAAHSDENGGYIDISTFGF